LCRSNAVKLVLERPEVTARITGANGKRQQHIGPFRNEQDAARTYDAQARQLGQGNGCNFGEHEHPWTKPFKRGKKRKEL